MKNSDYWKLRFQQLEQVQNGQGVVAFTEIEKQYKEAQNQIEGKIACWYQRFANNNKISLAEARKYLKDSDLKELKWDIQDYIKYGEENALTGKWLKELENASAKFHISRLEALKLQIQQSMEVLFSKQHQTMQRTLSDVFKSTYYHTAYELQHGFKIGWDIAGLDQAQIEKVLLKPWAVDGYNFSERIWKNKEKLISEVYNELTRNIMLGADPQKAIDSLAKKMNTSKRNAGRLIMTEEAYFSSIAQKECFDNLDVEQYEIVATLDSHTSDICRSFDGKVFPMKDFQPGVTAPPFHVYCRSTTVPYFDENFGDIGERAARNEEIGKTYYVPANMTYQEWEEAFVNGDKSGLQEVENDDTINNIFELNIEEQLLHDGFDFMSEEVYDEAILSNRATISEDERKHIYGFDWDNFRNMNKESGYFNTLNSEVINFHMRNNKEMLLNNNNKQTIEILKKAIANNISKENYVANRYVDIDWFNNKFLEADRYLQENDYEGCIQELKKKLNDNFQLTDEQFVSVSLNDNSMYNTRQIKLVLEISNETRMFICENRMESEAVLYKPSYEMLGFRKQVNDNSSVQIEILMRVVGDGFDE